MPKLTIRSETGESTSHDLVEETHTVGRSPREFDPARRQFGLRPARGDRDGGGELLPEGSRIDERNARQRPTPSPKCSCAPAIESALEKSLPRMNVKSPAPPSRCPAWRKLPLARRNRVRARWISRTLPYFRIGRRERDPARTAIFAAAALALLAFVASLHRPRPDEAPQSLNLGLARHSARNYCTLGIPNQNPMKLRFPDPDRLTQLHRSCFAAARTAAGSKEARVTQIIRDVKLLPADAAARAAAVNDKVSEDTGVRPAAIRAQS